MSVNKYERHLFVIPEDDANHQIALGFVLHHQVDHRRIQVMSSAGGWRRVLQTFEDQYVRRLKENQFSHVLMLIDFDNHVEERKIEFHNRISSDLQPRVFHVGSLQNPEHLKGELKLSFEKIGESLADDCFADKADAWGHRQLQHNESEYQRLIQIVKPFVMHS